jgi:membrane fusion protein, multidrug efflux system
MRWFAGCVLVSIWVFSSCGGKKQAASPEPPQVQVVAVSSQEVLLEKDFVGQVYGHRDIPVRARVEGFLEKISFQEGSPVRKGAKLYTIDPDPLREAVIKAQSELASVEARFERASSDLDRIAPLAEMNAVSKMDLDAAQAEYNATLAMVEASQANVRLAEIRLSYATVYAPIDGIIGKTLAREGEFVGLAPNPVILNTVSSIDSVRVEFFLTEKDYLALVQTEGAADASARLPLKLLLADGEIYPYTGRVEFMNREVDAATGAILISAIFPNPERIVRPGQFARVRAVVNTLPDALLVPQRCISEVQGRFSVLRVDAQGAAERVPVSLGPTYRDYFVVLEGLGEGDRVVLEGLQRAARGGQVTAVEVEFVSQYAAE